MNLLVDGDLFCYRCAASAENDDAEVAFEYMNKLLDQCITRLNGTSYQMFLTGQNNFRFNVYPEYKATRIKVEKPKHLHACRQYLIDTHNAILSDGCEADDLMGVYQCRNSEPTTIVSLDKDMLMIPGWHYSWYIEGGPKDKRWTREEKLQEVDELSGYKKFYTQMLTGDASDNIKGVSGCGPKGAAKLLDGATSEQEMFNIVRDAYGNDDAMLMNGQCLWIWRKPNDIWKMPYD